MTYDKIREIVVKVYEEKGKPELNYATEYKTIIDEIDETYKIGDRKTIYNILEELTDKYNPDRTDWDEIDMSKCPQNNYVDIYYPDGTLICHTNSDIEFNYVRSCIKEMKSVGFYFVYNGERIGIDKFGNLHDWPNDLFDKLLRVTMKLL